MAANSLTNMISSGCSAVGTHSWSAAFQRHYHNGSLIINDTLALPDTSFLISVLDKDIVEVGGVRLNILDEYATGGTIVFVNDTGLYCGPSCHKITLNYNYNANTINLTDGIYNINYVDDTLISYNTTGH
jgi:hypothetical protein